MVNYVYYDARSVIQRESMRDIEAALKALEQPIEVARWPSGHKVWRIPAPKGKMPVLTINTQEYGQVQIEPTTSYPLEDHLSEWVGVAL